MTPATLYTITFLPAEQAVEVVADFPAAGAAYLDLAMAVWSPGFYRLEAYAARLSGLTASDADGARLEVEQLAANRWRVATVGAATARVHYRLACSDQSVTTNWVDQRVAVLNGPATFLMQAGTERRPCEVRLVTPDGWQVQTALLPVGDEAGRFYAASFDVLADSPILAGELEAHTFAVEGCDHHLVLAGERAALDGPRAARDLAAVLHAHRGFWGFLPFQRYHILVICREGGGGLEHADSMLVTAAPARVVTAEGYRAWIGLASHEYFHAVNVKRLRPVELGPFDYERPPRTASLWFAEGITCYYGELLLCRAGFASEAEALASLSTQIARLQAMPGRLVQTLEESSAEVWNNSFSGLNTAPDAVSYYTKGHVVAFLLDVEIQRATGGAAALDDLMRLAYRRFSGERGFTPEQMRALTAELGGEGVAVWLDAAVSSTAELDYGPALAWLGLRFAGAQDGAPEDGWRLAAASGDDDAAQRRQAWLSLRQPD